MMRKWNDGILHDHEAPIHPDSMIERIMNTREGRSVYPRYKQRIRLKQDDLSPTILSGGIRSQPLFYHPIDPRGLTIRERCRLQSIPDHVVLEVGKTQGRYLTGNAVPPLLTYHFGIIMKKALRGEMELVGLEKMIKHQSRLL